MNARISGRHIRNLAESIASSQDLADKVAAFAFVGKNDDTIAATPVTTLETESPSSADVVGIALLSWVGLILLPLVV